MILLGSIIAATGCTHNVSGNIHKTPGHKKGKTPATQRPYVINNKTYYPVPSAQGYKERGIASWYGKPFHGRKTSNGETYNMYDHTAAHKTLPMNTMLLVKNLNNGRSTVVRINDRGPFVRKRIIDLSKKAAEEIGMIGTGTAKIEIIALAEEIHQPYPKRKAVAETQKKTKKKDIKTIPAPQVAGRKASPSASQPVKQPKQLVYQDFDKGNFYIQVGAFEHRDNARKLAEKFAATGKDVIIQQFPAAGTRLYRVMSYSGTSLKQAKAYERYLEHHGYPNAYVIARETKELNQ